MASSHEHQFARRIRPMRLSTNSYRPRWPCYRRRQGTLSVLTGTLGPHKSSSVNIIVTPRSNCCANQLCGYSYVLLHVVGALTVTEVGDKAMTVVLGAPYKQISDAGRTLPNESAPR